MNRIELLLPARDVRCGITAIGHGADAVYIGAPAFGARQAAKNSLQDIEELVKYAHLYGSKVHVTVNTLIFDNELEEVRRLLYSLYNIGVDAVLIQDLGILKLDLPPLAFHASTQCHNDTLGRIQFLERLGFVRVVLARETDLKTISEIRANTSVELEAFVHGALCVSYSGQCYISDMLSGRSGNRGACAQICRTRFDLQDAARNTLIAGKHLLSLRDMCRANYIGEMMQAGITSFKVEGRLKNEYYVKNITSFYRQKIDNIMEKDSTFRRESSGITRFFFTPDIKKTFNRGFTDYFLNSKRERIASFDTPKAIGERIGILKKQNHKYLYFGDAEISNGDGLCFINKEGELEGFLVNDVKNNQIIPQKMLSDFKEVEVYRNIDKKFERILDGRTAERKIGVEMQFEATSERCRIAAKDEDGIEVFVEEQVQLETAEQLEKMNETLRNALSKLGNTPFEASVIGIDNEFFIRSAFINEMKSKLVEKLVEARTGHFRPQDRPLDYRPGQVFESADYKRNIINEKHREVYEDFGAREIEYGTDKTRDFSGKTLMTCKYCLRYELGWCGRENEKCPPQPLRIVSGRHSFKLSFDCKNCIMKVENR